MRSSLFAALMALLFVFTLCAASDPPILVEAEGFAESGGWVIDPQFMDNMGSPYLLAHGLGRPVADAQTSVKVPLAGN